MSGHGSHEFGRDCPACIKDSQPKLLCPVCRREVAETESLRAEVARLTDLLASQRAEYETALALCHDTVRDLTAEADALKAELAEMNGTPQARWRYFLDQMLERFPDSPQDSLRSDEVPEARILARVDALRFALETATGAAKINAEERDEAREETVEACARRVNANNHFENISRHHAEELIRATPLDATPLADRIAELEAELCKAIAWLDRCSWARNNIDLDTGPLEGQLAVAVQERDALKAQVEAMSVELAQRQDHIESLRAQVERLTTAARRALQVGEIRFRTCVLAADVNDALTEALKEKP